MKQCSTCNKTYDDGLKFCLADGSPLFTVVEGAGSRSSSNIPQPAVATIQKSNPLFLYVVFAGLFILIGLVAATLIRSDSNIFAITKSENPVNASMPAQTQTSYESQPPGSVTYSQSRMSNSGNATSDSRPAIPSPDTEQIKRKISERIYSWKQAGEARDVNLYMQNYAEMVDYYKKKAANRSFVSSDKQRAFSKYSSISLTIDIVSITPDSSGNQADVLIDKAWLFQGGGYLAGKVRQQLQFKLINGEWLISGEKDLKVYYVNS